MNVTPYYRPMDIMVKKRRHRTLSGSRLGAAAVEFAVIAPVMLLVTFGMIEMGRMMMVKNAATQATREGVRLAILPGANNQGVINRVTEELELMSIYAATIETVPADVATAPHGSTITVRVRIDPDTVRWVPAMGLPIPEIVAESAMRRESTN